MLNKEKELQTPCVWSCFNAHIKARATILSFPFSGWKKYDTTYWEQEGCNLHLDLDDAHALAAKGLPDDGSNRSESFLDARRAAYWKADQLVTQEQDQDAAEQAETSMQGQQALEDRGPVALSPCDGCTTACPRVGFCNPPW